MQQEIFNWIWLALFVTMVTVRKWHERKAGQRVTLKGTPIGEGVLMVLWGVAAGVLPLFYLFGTWLDFADLPFDMPWVIGAFGTLLFITSIWLLHRSHAELGEAWSSTVEPGGDNTLVREGVYSMVRHPMYSAHLLWGLAQFLLLPNLIAGSLALPLLLAVIALRVPREEQALLERFGATYRQYMHDTGRFLPKLTIG